MIYRNKIAEEENRVVLIQTEKYPVADAININFMIAYLLMPL